MRTTLPRPRRLLLRELNFFLLLLLALARRGMRGDRLGPAIWVGEWELDTHKMYFVQTYDTGIMGDSSFLTRGFNLHYVP